MSIYPFLSIDAKSPVKKYPSSSKAFFVASSFSKYPLNTCGPLTAISPTPSSFRLTSFKSVPCNFCPTEPSLYFFVLLPATNGAHSVKPYPSITAIP